MEYQVSYGRARMWDDMNMTGASHLMGRPSWLIHTPSIIPKPIRSVECLKMRLAFVLLMMNAFDFEAQENNRKSDVCTPDIVAEFCLAEVPRTFQ